MPLRKVSVHSSMVVIYTYSVEAIASSLTRISQTTKQLQKRTTFRQLPQQLQLLSSANVGSQTQLKSDLVAERVRICATNKRNSRRFKRETLFLKKKKRPNSKMTSKPYKMGRRLKQKMIYISLFQEKRLH